MKAFRIIVSILLVAIIGLVSYVGFFTGDAITLLPMFQKSAESELEGKTVVFLGSSITNGMYSYNISFVDYLTSVYKVNAIKEAVNNTTLVENGDNSYVSRLKKIDKDMNVQMVICQLSTNDANKKMPLGEIGNMYSIESFDTSTVAGAIEYIICYCDDTWNCPVGFYTAFKYDSPEYEAMYQILLQVEQKWHMPILDFWTNEEVNAHDKKMHMVDDVHPTLLCYKDDMTPAFYDFILENIK